MNIGHGREEKEEKQNILALYRQFQWNFKLPLAKIGLSNIAAQALIACYVLEYSSPCGQSFPTVLMNSQICLLPSGTLQNLNYLAHFFVLFSFHGWVLPLICLLLSLHRVFFFPAFHSPRTQTHSTIPEVLFFKNKLLQRMGHKRCKTSSEKHSRASIKVKLNHWNHRICQRLGHALLDCTYQLILGHFLPEDCFLSLFSPFKDIFLSQKAFFFQYWLVIWVGSDFFNVI